MKRPSEISVMTTMCEPYILDDITIREVSFDKMGTRLYIKLQGTNNKSEQVEQIKINLSVNDSEELAKGINEVIKQGLFGANENNKD